MIGDEHGMSGARDARGLLRARHDGLFGGRGVLVLAGLLGALVLAGAAILTSGAPRPRPARRAAAVQPSAPSAVDLAASRGVGSDQRGFWARQSGGGLEARNAKQRMSASFAAGGVRVSAPGGSIGLRLGALGRGSDPRAALRVNPTVNANRVSYDRGGADEWYSNGPLGLEQGLTLHARPAGSGRAPLTVAYALSGAGARLDDGQVVFSAGGKSILRYSGLTATDAHGRLLPASLSLVGRRLLIHVEDRGARYPITIDPLLQVATLTANDANQGFDLGYSIAQAGTTLAVGDPEADPISGSTPPQDAGAVYVFTEPTSGWANATQAAILTASSTSPSNALGYSVAVSASGQTVYAGAPDSGSDYQGAVYVFDQTGGAWSGNVTQSSVLSSSTSQYDSAQLGFSVAVSGPTIFAGAPGMQSTNALGGVAVFNSPTGVTEAPSALLTPPANDYDYLGISVAVSSDGQTLVSGGGFGPAVDVFTEPHAGWATSHAPSARLTDPAIGLNDELGASVAIDGDTIAAGAPSFTGGVVVVYQGSPGWTTTSTPTATLSPSGSTIWFGLSIAMAQFPASAADSGGVAGDVETIYASSSGQGVYRFAEPAGGWTDDTEPAALGLQTASAFSLDLAGGYLYEGEDNNGTTQTVTSQVNVFDAPSSATSVSCVPNPVTEGSSVSCLATVTGTQPVPTVPTGSVTFTSSGSGTFAGSSCALVQQTSITAACTVTYTPTASGAQTITAAYGGDTTHTQSSDSTALTVNTSGGGGGGGAPVGGGSTHVTGVPLNTAAPAISGTPLPGHTLSCSHGSWSNSPTSFSYQWWRGGTAIGGATGSAYSVQILDEAQTLTCTVTASNAAGAGAPATSAGDLVAVRGTLSCAKPSGHLGGISVGPLSLGMTLAQARSKLHRSTVTHNGFDNFCLYAGWGIRAGVASQRLLHAVPRSSQALGGKIVLALTANPYYSLHGARPGFQVSTVQRRLKLGKAFHIGLNSWYVARGARADLVLKVRHGVIQEVGLANKRLTSGRQADRRFLSSFRAG